MLRMSSDMRHELCQHSKWRLDHSCDAQKCDCMFACLLHMPLQIARDKAPGIHEAQLRARYSTVAVGPGVSSSEQMHARHPVSGRGDPAWAPR